MRAVLIRLVPLAIFLSFAAVILALWGGRHTTALLGVGLAFGAALLLHLALPRMVPDRRERDVALGEVGVRERAPQALLDSEALYRGIFAAAHDGLVLLNAEEEIVEANRVACELFDRKPEELRGSSFLALFAEAPSLRWEGFREQLASEGEARLALDRSRIDGATVELEVRGRLLTDGGDPWALATLVDLTEQRSSERRRAQLARKVLVAQEEERARISRELHDELGQLMTALRFELGLLQKQSVEPSPEVARAHERAIQLTEKAVDELRHICKRLRPPMLDDLGLEPAVHQLVEDFVEHSGLEVRLDLDLDEAEAPLPTEVTLCAYRVLQESLTNVGRHARARSVSVSLRQQAAELTASIYDDGRGFELSDLPTIESSGVTGMRERAGLVGGTVEIRSEPFQGTRVELRVPLSDSFFKGAA